MVNIKINNIAVTATEGSTILQAAHTAGFSIPTLCYLKEINEIGACRICMVEVKGQRNLVAACVFPINEGMEILTNTERVLRSRRKTLELILSTHDKNCLVCSRSGNCELQKLCKDFDIQDQNAYAGENERYEIDKSAVHLVRDNNKCILCRRCVAVCEKQQIVSVIGANDRGFKTHIGSAYDMDLADTSCVSCGQCIVVCPTGALTIQDDTKEVMAAIADPAKHVIVQTAPAVRATLGECFGMPIGTEVTGKMAAALRRLGFDGVFDTDFAADLTIVEEASEFLERLQNNGVLPMITSCSPGWISYCESHEPDFIPNLSTCKSPQQMFGSVAKTWYAKKMGLDPKNIFVVSIMPCTAKKMECGRTEMSAAGEGIADVDIALTTRELAHMIERAGMDFTRLPNEEFDAPLGTSSGAGVIFGATGGVMEAALRTAVEWVSGEELTKLDFADVRGMDAIKEASYTIGSIDLKVAVVSGLASAKKLLQRIRAGEANYHFIEIMGCPGGCINGGGQPIQPASVRNFVDIRALRAAALYNADQNKTVRKSHLNADVMAIYDDFLEAPGSHEAHHILHTTYTAREKF